MTNTDTKQSREGWFRKIQFYFEWNPILLWLKSDFAKTWGWSAAANLPVGYKQFSCRVHPIPKLGTPNQQAVCQQTLYCFLANTLLFAGGAKRTELYSHENRPLFSQKQNSILTEIELCFLKARLRHFFLNSNCTIHHKLSAPDFLRPVLALASERVRAGSKRHSRARRALSSPRPFFIIFLIPAL